jgi:hypothetical protein
VTAEYAVTVIYPDAAAAGVKLDDLSVLERIIAEIKKWISVRGSTGSRVGDNREARHKLRLLHTSSLPLLAAHLCQLLR